jgi:hypothetical protein
MKQLTPVLLQWVANGGQGQNARRAAFPLQNGHPIVQRVVEQKEPLPTVAEASGVSHETIRRLMLSVQKPCGQQEA